MRILAALVVLLVLGQVVLAVAAGNETCPRSAIPCAAGERAQKALPPGFLDVITPEKMAARITQLQSYGTRYTYSSKIDEAAGYILGEFTSMGLTAHLQSFPYNGFTMSNVVAVLPGRDASLPWCVVGAHYDSVNGSDSYTNPSAPAPGADDDASGVAAVLGAAEAFARAPTNRTILFVAFTAEEQGRVGSSEFVRQLKENGTALAGAFCFDMIGYNQRHAKVDLVSNADSAWLSQLARNASYPLGMLTEMVLTNDTPYRWSDQVSFWEAGYPAMYFIEDENPTENSANFLANPYYHSGGDTLDKLNLSLMTRVARLGAASLAGLAGLALPDFWPVLARVPDPALMDEPVMFNISVANAGEPVARVNISLFVDGELWESRAIVPDGIQYVYISWIPTAGAHHVSIVADAEGRFAEWDRSNDRLELPLEVKARPDFMISEFRASDAAPLPGQALDLIAWVGNSGGAQAAGRLVIAQEDGTLILDERLILPAGASEVVVVNASAPAAAALYTARITDVQPWENYTGNNERNTTVVPHILDVSGLRLDAAPEAAFARQEIRFEVLGGGPAPGNEYYFDFGDGFGAGWTNASSLSCIYERTGTFNATVTVRDARGAIASLTPVPVLVLDQHPVPVIETDGTVPRVGKPVQFSGERSYDPDGSINQYSWEFGDGAFALGPRVTHAFGSLKTYIVRLTVADDGEFYNVTTLAVTMVDSPPVARLSVSSRVLFAGEDALFNASGSSDPDGRMFAWEWDFGDGRSASGASANHTYPAPGRYTVSLTVRDDLGVTNVTRAEMLVYKMTAVTAPSAGGGGGSGQRTAALVIALIVLLLVAVLGLNFGGRDRGHKGDEEE